MKIALLHYSSPPIVGGVESVLAHHARLMADAGHSVIILTGRGEPFDPRIPVHVLPRLDSRHTQVMKVKQLLDSGKITPAFDTLKEQIIADLSAQLEGVDMLVAHNVASLHKNLPLTAAIHEIYQRPFAPKLILWHHDLAWTTPRYSSEMHPGYPWDLLRSQWTGAAHVVISAVRRQELSDLINLPAESIHVIPNGVDTQSFFKLEEQTVRLSVSLGLDEADPLLLLPARLTARKNIEQALQITAALKLFYPKVGLLITGPEGPHNPANAQYKEKLLHLRDTLNLQQNAHFLAEIAAGFLPDAVIADFYRLADALLFPSYEEGFGIPVIEAAFSAKPVFCADIPVLRELGGDDVSYFTADTDPATIAEQIRQRLESEKTSRWSRLAKHTYTWNAIYLLHIEPLLKEVIL